MYFKVYLIKKYICKYYKKQLKSVDSSCLWDAALKRGKVKRGGEWELLSFTYKPRVLCDFLNNVHM